MALNINKEKRLVMHCITKALDLEGYRELSQELIQLKNPIEFDERCRQICAECGPEGQVIE